MRILALLTVGLCCWQSVGPVPTHLLYRRRTKREDDLMKIEMKHPTEIGFIISGADEFGGDQTRKFKEVIKEHIGDVVNVFDVDSDDIYYSMAWAHTQRKKEETYEEVTTHMNDQERFLKLVDSFIEVNAPIGHLSTQAGLQHAISWVEADSSFYSEPTQSEIDDFAPKPVDRILIIMTHYDVPGSEVEDMFPTQCRLPLVYVWIWPDTGDMGCNNGRVKKTMKTFAAHLNATKYFKHDMTFCGKNQDSLDDFQEHLIEQLEVHQELRVLCHKKNLVGATTMEGEKKPCPTIDGLEVDCDQEEMAKDCTKLTVWECYPWLIFAVPTGSIIGIAMIIIVAVSQVIEYRKRQAEKREQYSLRSALYIHYQVELLKKDFLALMGSRSGRCMAAALKATTEKLAERERKNERKNKKSKDKEEKQKKSRSDRAAADSRRGSDSQGGGDQRRNDSKDSRKKSDRDRDRSADRHGDAKRSSSSGGGRGGQGRPSDSGISSSATSSNRTHNNNTSGNNNNQKRHNSGGGDSRQTNGAVQPKQSVGGGSSRGGSQRYSNGGSGNGGTPTRGAGQSVRQGGQGSRQTGLAPDRMPARARRF